jgi:hypothetical protein
LSTVNACRQASAELVPTLTPVLAPPWRRYRSPSAWASVPPRERGRALVRSDFCGEIASEHRASHVVPSDVCSNIPDTHLWSIYNVCGVSTPDCGAIDCASAIHVVHYATSAALEETLHCADRSIQFARSSLRFRKLASSFNRPSFARCGQDPRRRERPLRFCIRPSLCHVLP